MQGVVSQIGRRDFGFIRAQGRTIFFHRNSLSPKLPFDKTLLHRLVEFETIDGKKGTSAFNVRPA